MLRFLSGDFWTLDINALPESLIPEKEYDLMEFDCVCLLSGFVISNNGLIFGIGARKQCGGLSGGKI